MAFDLSNIGVSKPVSKAETETKFKKFALPDARSAGGETLNFKAGAADFSYKLGKGKNFADYGFGGENVGAFAKALGQKIPMSIAQATPAGKVNPAAWNALLIKAAQYEEKLNTPILYIVAEQDGTIPNVLTVTDRAALGDQATDAGDIYVYNPSTGKPMKVCGPASLQLLQQNGGQKTQLGKYVEFVVDLMNVLGYDVRVSKNGSVSASACGKQIKAAGRVASGVVGSMTAARQLYSQIKNQPQLVDKVFKNNSFELKRHTVKGEGYNRKNVSSLFHTTKRTGCNYSTMGNAMDANPPRRSRVKTAAGGWNCHQTQWAHSRLPDTAAEKQSIWTKAGYGGKGDQADGVWGSRYLPARLAKLGARLLAVAAKSKAIDAGTYYTLKKSLNRDHNEAAVTAILNHPQIKLLMPAEFNQAALKAYVEKGEASGAVEAFLNSLKQAVPSVALA